MCKKNISLFPSRTRSSTPGVEAGRRYSAQAVKQGRKEKVQIASGAAQDRGDDRKKEPGNVEQRVSIVTLRKR